MVRLEKEAGDVLKPVTQFHILMQPIALSRVLGLWSQASISHLELIIIITTHLALLIYFTMFLSMLYPIGSQTTNPMWKDIVILILQVWVLRP